MGKLIPASLEKRIDRIHAAAVDYALRGTSWSHGTGDEGLTSESQERLGRGRW